MSDFPAVLPGEAGYIPGGVRDWAVPGAGDCEYAWRFFGGEEERAGGGDGGESSSRFILNSEA